MLLKYYFKIKHVKETDNARTNALNKKIKLQRLEKSLKAILKFYENGKIKYNHLKLVII